MSKITSEVKRDLVKNITIRINLIVQSNLSVNKLQSQRSSIYKFKKYQKSTLKSTKIRYLDNFEQKETIIT